jgi:hypothetical protein
MKSYKISSEFSDSKEFVVDLPKRFDQLGGLVIKDNRNVVKKVDTPHGTFVVKSFAGMYFFNRLAYSLFRKSKASRSYIYSKMLNEKGIATPAPVAWVNSYTCGLLTQSYFISVYEPHQTLEEILKHDSMQDESKKEELYHNLAEFTSRLHSLGIYHEDFSMGNILVIPTSDGYQFSLVDLNRIKFQNIGYRKGVRNFVKLGISQEDMNLLLSKYAILSQQSPERSINLFWKDKKRSSLLRKFRKRIRSYTVAPLERLLAGKAFLIFFDQLQTFIDVYSISMT